jgi:hypothetical protein
LLFLCLGLTALLLYWKVLTYPFIQDDWQWLLVFKQAEVSDTEIAFIRSLFYFEGALFFRPLGLLYLFAVYLWTGLNPALFHAFALLIHTTSAFLMVLLVWELIEDRAISVGAGLLYLGATSVHLDTLLWVVGIFELGTALFFLLALWLFARGKCLLSAAAFLIALLFKGSAIVLPVVLFSLAMDRGRWQWQGALRAGSALWLHWVVVAGFFYIKMHGASPLSFPGNHPYVIDGWGLHLFRNGYRYLAWICQSVLPYSLPFHKFVNAGLFLLWLLGLFLVGMWLRRKPVRGSERDVSRGTVLFWSVWCLVGIPPLLFLPHHVYRYYLTLSLPPFLVLFLLALEAGMRRIICPGRVKDRARAVIIGCCLLGSAYHFYRADREGLEQRWLVDGTNSLVMRAATVEEVYDRLVGAGEVFPEGAVVVLKDVDLWSLGKDSALRLWYDDDSIRVYDYDYLRKDTMRLYLDSPPENQEEGFTGGKDRTIYLEEEKTFAFGLEDGILRSIDLDFGNLKAEQKEGVW